MRTIFRSFSSLAMLLSIISGCAVGPRFQKPQAPTDADYTPTPLPQIPPSATLEGVTRQRLNLGQEIPYRWWESFGSQALNSLVERSFRENPTVNAAQAALGQAQELVYAQEGYFYPNASAEYNLERQMLAGNLSGGSAPGVQGNGTSITATQNPAPTNLPYNKPLYFNFHTATLTVGFVPDVFGLNRRKVESLDAQAQLQRFELEATYLSLASNVVAAAIQESSIRAQIDAVRAIIAHNEKSLAILHYKFDLGFATRLDVAAQEQQTAQAIALLPPLNKQFEQNRDLLRMLVGNLPNQDIPETFDFASLSLPMQLPLSLPSEIINQRPDVRAAAQQVRSANAQVGVAIASMLPDFTITGTAGGTATEFSQLFSSGGPFWTLIGDATQPIFQGGTLLHIKRAADQGLQQAAAQYQNTVLTAYQNVADTLHAIVNDADALTAAADAERAAKVTVDLLDQRVQHGYSDYLSELAAAVAYQQAVLSEVQARATRFEDTAALYQALGGGWWNRSYPTKAAELIGDATLHSATLR